jgi:hypothetical protein
MGPHCEMIEKMRRWMRQRGWDRLIGKERSFRQTLYHHVEAQLGVIECLRPLITCDVSFGLTDREVDALLVTALLHDLDKETEPWQSAVGAGRKPPGHVHRESVLRELPEWSRLADPQNAEGFEDLVIGACDLHHAAVRTPGAVLAQHLAGTAEPRWKILQELYADVDGVVSCDGAIEAARLAGHRWAGKLDVCWHAVDTVRGVSSALLNGAAVEAHATAGWVPLLYFVDGTVYAALPGTAARVKLCDVEELLAAKVAHLMPPDFEMKLVFGDPTAKFLVKREFVDSSPRKVKEYLQAAFRRMSPRRFEKQTPSKRSEALRIIAGQREFSNWGDRKRQLRELGTTGCLANVLRWFKALCLKDDSLLAIACPAEWERVSAVLNARLPRGWRRLTGLSTLKTADDLRAIKTALWDNCAFHTQGSFRKRAPEEQAELLISVLMQAYRAAYARLDLSALPSCLSPRKIAAVLGGDLRMPELSRGRSDFALEVKSYGETKASAAFGGQTLMCPLSNEAWPPSVELTGTDLVSGTDKHANRRRVGSKTWKNLGGFPVAPGMRLELLLRSVLLQSDLEDARLLAIIPPKNLGPIAGEELLKQVRLLDAEFLKAMDPVAPISERQIALSFTPWIAANIDEVGWYAGLASIAMRRREVNEATGRDLGEAILELLEVLEPEPGDGAPGTREQKLKRQAEGLRRLAEGRYGMRFESWPEAVAAFLDNTRQDVRELLQHDEALQDVRSRALRMRGPTILAETPNAVLFLMPQSLRTSKKESAVDTAIRELFLSIVFAVGTNCPCALLAMDEPLTFTGGEGMVRIPANAALRSHIASWRAGLRTAGAQGVAPPTHEWLVAKELDLWAEGLLAAHLIARWKADDDPDRGVFGGSSPLYQVLRIRSAGALVRRAEQRKVRTRWTSKELVLILNLARVTA